MIARECVSHLSHSYFLTRSCSSLFTCVYIIRAAKSMTRSPDEDDDDDDDDDRKKQTREKRKKREKKDQQISKIFF